MIQGTLERLGATPNKGVFRAPEVQFRVVYDLLFFLGFFGKLPYTSRYIEISVRKMFRRKYSIFSSLHFMSGGNYGRKLDEIFVLL